MFALAAIADFGESGVLIGRLAAMLRAWPRTPSDGQETLQVPHAAAGILRWAVVKRDRQVAPIWHPDRQLLVAGDVRLYNRSDLAEALGLSTGWEMSSDLAMVSQAFLRWGEDTPRRLRGDFAFVVWDERDRTLFAARDQLGVRPLYYQRQRDLLLLATDPVLFFPSIGRPCELVNEHKILDRFTRLPRTHGQTYFRGIQSLRPGHQITLDHRSARLRRFWRPSLGKNASPRPYADSCAEFRNLFRDAVRDRLESDYPIVAHSSGGFDSSSIVMTCDEIYRSGPARPQLLTASALTPGMTCDDSRYMNAVSRQTNFEAILWNALDPELSDVETPHLAFPGMRRGIGGGPRGEYRAAQLRNARVLLSGVVGDTVTFSFGIFRDLFRHRHWRSLIQSAAAIPDSNLRRHLAWSTLGLLPAATALRWKNAIATRAHAPPPWLGPALRALYPPPVEELEILDEPGISHLTCELWARITSPKFAAAIDSAVVRGILEGVEVRIPFADVRLIEHILSVPWRDRVPFGDFRRLARDSLRGVLPAEFETRRDQGSWSGTWARSARHLFPATRRMMADGAWRSAPYISLRHAQAMLDEIEGTWPNSDPSACVLVGEFGVLEAWLRQVFRYDTRLEVNDVRSCEE